MMELNVAGEKIIRFKNEKDALELLAAQANDLINFIKENKAELPLSTLDNIYRFFSYNELRKEELGALKEKLFYLSISVNSGLNFSITLEHSSYNSLTWVNFDANAIFQLLIKSLKLFFNASGQRQTELFNRFEEFSHISEKEFTHRFEKEFSHRFEEFSRRFEKDFTYIFEELSRRFETDFAHGFGELSHIFEKEFSHLFEKFSLRFDNEEFSHIFEKEFSHIFEKEFSHIFEKEFSHLFEKEFPHMSEKDFAHRFEEFFHRFENPYQGLLLSMVVSSFLTHRRKGRMFSFLDLYLRLYYFYLIVSNSISIEQADKFELKF